MSESAISPLINNTSSELKPDDACDELDSAESTNLGIHTPAVAAELAVPEPCKQESESDPTHPEPEVKSDPPIEPNNGKDNGIDVASLNPEDEEFQRILELDEKRVAYKCLTSLSYHSQQDLQTLSQYTHEIDGIMDEVRKSNDDAKIHDLCKTASTVEEKRKVLQDKVDALQKVR